MLTAYCSSHDPFIARGERKLPTFTDFISLWRARRLNNHSSQSHISRTFHRKEGIIIEWIPFVRDSPSSASNKHLRMPRPRPEDEEAENALRISP
jgi:hypothetical protein